MFLSLNHAGRLPAPLTVGTVERGRVCRLSGGAEINQRLAAGGIVPDCRLDSVVFNGQNGQYVVETNGRTTALDPADAATVWIV